MGLDKFFEIVKNMGEEKLRDQIKSEEAAKPTPDVLPEGNSGSGTIHGYIVQARYMYTQPIQIDGNMLDRQWRNLHFKEGAVGVPVGNRYDLPTLVNAHCYSYESAEALRWWFLASAAAAGIMGALCLETRIVEYSIAYSHKATPERHLAYIEQSHAPRSASEPEAEL